MTEEESLAYDLCLHGFLAVSFCHGSEAERLKPYPPSSLYQIRCGLMHSLRFANRSEINFFVSFVFVLEAANHSPDIYHHIRREVRRKFTSVPSITTKHHNKWVRPCHFQLWPNVIICICDELFFFLHL